MEKQKKYLKPEAEVIELPDIETVKDELLKLFKFNVKPNSLFIKLKYVLLFSFS